MCIIYAHLVGHHLPAKGLKWESYPNHAEGSITRSIVDGSPTPDLRKEKQCGIYVL